MQIPTRHRPRGQPHHGFYRLLSLTRYWLICLSGDHTRCCLLVVGIIPFAPRSHTQSCACYKNRPAHHLICRSRRDGFVGHIIPCSPSLAGLNISQEPQDMRGFPGYGQLRNLTFLDHLYHPVEGRHTQYNRALLHSWVIKDDGYLIFVITGYAWDLYPHYDEACGLYQYTPNALNRQNGTPNLLGEAVKGEHIHLPPLGIGGSYKIELSPIIQQAGSLLSIYDGLAPALGSNPSLEGIRVQEWQASIFYVVGAGWGAGDPGRGGALALAAGCADLFFGGPLGFRGL